MTFVDKIKNLAKTRNTSISTIEKALGLSNGSIGKWDVSIPRVDNLLKVSEFLNVSIEYFLVDDFNSIKEDTTDNDITELIDTYNKLDSRGKHMVQSAAYKELDRMGKLIENENTIIKRGIG